MFWSRRSTAEPDTLTKMIGLPVPRTAFHSRFCESGSWRSTLSPALAPLLALPPLLPVLPPQAASRETLITRARANASVFLKFIPQTSIEFLLQEHSGRGAKPCPPFRSGPISTYNIAACAARRRQRSVIHFTLDHRLSVHSISIFYLKYFQEIAHFKGNLYI